MDKLKFPINDYDVNVPDGTPIRKVHAIEVRRFDEYYKLILRGKDVSWAVRAAGKISATNIISLASKGECIPYYYYKDKIFKVELPSHSRSDTDKENAVKISELDLSVSDPCFYETKSAETSVTKHERRTTEVVKENKEMNEMNVINGAITYDKQLAFNVDGKYVYIDDTGTRKEVLPNFLLATNIPALIPAVSKGIKAGDYYKYEGKLYKALEDNKVIDLGSGIVANIQVSTIPMTDATVVYKPVMTSGKLGIKDIVKAQMFAKMDNPMMAAMLMGDGDVDAKSMLMLNMVNGKAAAGADNNMLPLLMLGDGDVDTKEMLMLSMMNSKNGGKNDINSVLPLMLLDKGEGSSMEDILLMQAIGGANSNALLPLLLLKKDKKNKKADKKDE